MIWFTLNVIARPTQGLALTTLEITTMAFVFSTVGTCFCWRWKPMDVTTTISVEGTTTMEQITHDAGPAISGQYKNSPLDFLGPHDWIMTLLWRFNVNILRRLGLIRKSPKVWRARRLTSFNFPAISHVSGLFILCFGMAYSAIFLAAWNFTFPSSTEALLWRICASVVFGLTPVVGVVEILSIKSGRQRHVEVGMPQGFAIPSQQHPRASQQASQNRATPNQVQTAKSDPSKSSARLSVLSTSGLPLRALRFTEPIAAIYTTCRLFILVEDIIGLRALPASAFQTVNWTAYWPHF
jgi:hypothetical protein